jgi:RNA polymerase sigma-70 factor (ECF subfamily)
MEGTRTLDSVTAVSRARSGDPEAFGKLVQQFQGPIVRYLYRLTGDNELARDLAQDTFVRAYEGLARTTPDLPFKTWLYRIATNNALQHRRRSRLLSFLPFGSDRSPQEVATEDRAGPPDASLAIQETLLKIPEKNRLCMILHFVDGFRYGEIAATLGISEDAVRMRVARGSERFRRLYGNPLGVSNEVQ